MIRDFLFFAAALGTKPRKNEGWLYIKKYNEINVRMDCN
jgi:hypothetical protein